MMKKYTVTTNEDLRLLCIKNNWFTCGSNEQYEKLFRANEGLATIEEIATIIWICSDENQWCRNGLNSMIKKAVVAFGGIAAIRKTIDSLNFL